MTAGPVGLDRSPDGMRCRLVVDRPPGNLLSFEVVAALRAALARTPDLGPLKLLTIEGSGSDFSFGAAIGEHAPDQIGRVLPATHQLLRELLDAPVTTAAIVRGRCLGGGFELALACDFVFAAEDARLGLPEIALGVFPPAAAALLPLRIGASRAAAALLQGDIRPASDWLSFGVIAGVAPTADLDAEVARWFDRHLRPRSAAALRHAVKASRLAIRAQFEPVLAAAERIYLDELMHTRDSVEGIAAFLEKRPPKWSDG